MKRKMISILLCAALSLSLLAGCGGSKENSESTETSVKETEEEEKTENQEVADEEVVAEEEESPDKEVSLASVDVSAIGLTEEDAKFIVTTVETKIQDEYLTPNNISIEDFSVPDDDESWKFFAKCTSIALEMEGIGLDELCDMTALIIPLSSEEEETIMTAITLGFKDAVVELDQGSMLTMFLFDENLLNTVRNLIVAGVFAD